MGTQYLIFFWSENLCLCSLFVQISSLDSHFLWFQKKQNKICTRHCFKKKTFAWSPLALLFFSELFFIPLSFLSFFELLCRNLLLFLFISCFFKCVSFFLSFLSFVLFFGVVYIFFVNIVFSESSSFKCVSFLSFFDSLFWSLCFDPFVLISLFLRNNYRCLSSVVSFFLVLFLVHHFFLPQNFSFFYIPFVCLFLFLNKNKLFFSVVVSSILNTFLDTIFCFCIFLSLFFCSFVFSWNSLFVFHISFYCVGFFSFCSVPFFSLLFIPLILLLLLLDLFSFLFDNTLFDSLSLFFYCFSLSLSFLLFLFLPWFLS